MIERKLEVTAQSGDMRAIQVRVDNSPESDRVSYGKFEREEELQAWRENSLLPP